MRSRGLFWMAAACLYVGAALTCQGAEYVDDYRANVPASPQQRAEARQQRKARKAALLEQDGGTAEAEEPEPARPPPPPPPPEPKDAGAPEISDAGVADAGPGDAGAPAADAGNPIEALCQTLCARAIECAQRMLNDLPPEIAKRMREQLEEQAKRCREECLREGGKSDAARIARARQCMQEKDCEKFMKCMQDVLDKH